MFKSVASACVAPTLIGCGPTRPDIEGNLPPQREADVRAGLLDVCVGTIFDQSAARSRLERAGFSRKFLQGDFEVYGTQGDSTLVFLTGQQVAAQTRCVITAQGLSQARSVEFAREVADRVDSLQVLTGSGSSAFDNVFGFQTVDGDFDVAVRDVDDQGLYRAASIFVVGERSTFSGRAEGPSLR